MTQEMSMGIWLIKSTISRFRVAFNPENIEGKLIARKFLRNFFLDFDPSQDNLSGNIHRKTVFKNSEGCEVNKSNFFGIFITTRSEKHSFHGH